MFLFFLIVAIVVLLLTAATCLALGDFSRGKSLLYSRVVFVLLDGIFLVGIILSGSLLRNFPYGAAAINFMTVVLLGQCFFVLFCALRFLGKKLSRKIYSMPLDRKKRKLLSKAVVYPAGAAACSLYGNLYERKTLQENHYEIAVDNLAAEADGLQIAQLSDIHIGLFYSLEDLRLLLEKTAAAKPDVLVLTGDVFDSREMNREAVKLVDSFCGRFPLGIWFCRGNHEHMRGMTEIERYLSDTSIHELVNRAELLVPGDKPLYLAGVDYPIIRSQFKELQEKFMAQALKNVPAEAAVVLLAHHPDFIDSAFERKIPLTLTGHTHGGQICFLGLPVFHVFKYMRGSYWQDNCCGYVHSGNGSWFPYRFGCPPEVAYFTLKRKN